MEMDVFTNGFEKDNVAYLKAYVQKMHIDIKSHKDSDYPLLHWALGGRARNVTSWLLTNGVDVNEKGGDIGWTPLMVAANSGFKEGIHLLLERGANKKAMDNSGRTAVDLAQDPDLRQLLTVPTVRPKRQV